MQPIVELAKEHDLAIVEDAAQAIGATANGTQVGAIGDFGCFSFYPTKNLGGLGDGGIITTDDDDHAETLRRLRNHGQHPRYYHHLVGCNSRLDSLQAAALGVKLPHVTRWSEARKSHAARYDQEFTSRGVATAITLPTVASGVSTV